MTGVQTCALPISLADDTVSNPQGVKIGMKGDEALKLMDGLEYTQSDRKSVV